MKHASNAYKQRDSCNPVIVPAIQIPAIPYFFNTGAGIQESRKT